ncbi:MAG TPA: hypothetical protein VMV43_01660 [Candidatus Nanopelagicaceae bacterium]|nr:hypothetical protein [Candidatus Nanopelagicaceae bacterium]
MGASSLAVNVITLVVLIACFIKVMKNDLTHLQRDTTEIKANVKQISITVSEHGERLSNIEGKLSK